jgi:signal transduction histidine kinase
MQFQAIYKLARFCFGTIKNTEVLKVLHTTLITDLGLKDSFITLREEIMTVSKIKFITNHFDEQPLNDKFKLTLCRIIQEQTTNILKHAKAHTACITISNKEIFILLK